MSLDHSDAFDIERPDADEAARHAPSLATQPISGGGRSAENRARIVAHLRSTLLIGDRSQVWE
jgi:hypothetical protein